MPIGKCAVVNQTSTSRREFAKLLAASTAGAGAAAAVPATALASPGDDSALLELEEEIFEALYAANDLNEEIVRLDA